MIETVIPIPVTPHRGRILALELELASGSESSAPVTRAAQALRLFADQLDQLLTTANNLSASVDAVHLDRLSLARELDKVRQERDSYQTQLEQTQLKAPAHADV